MLGDFRNSNTRFNSKSHANDMNRPCNAQLKSLNSWQIFNIDCMTHGMHCFASQYVNIRLNSFVGNF